MSTQNQLNPAKVVAVLPVSGDSEHVRLEIRDKIDRGGPISLLQALNKSDSRFSSNRQIMWQFVTVPDAKEYFPELSETIDLVVSEGERYDLDKEYPLVYQGIPAKIQITEDHTPENDWAVENLHRSAKQNGENKFCVVGDLLIFTHKELIAGNPEHTFVEHDAMVSDISGYKYVVEDVAEEVHLSSEQLSEMAPDLSM